MAAQDVVLVPSCLFHILQGLPNHSKKLTHESRKQDGKSFDWAEWEPGFSWIL